MNKKTNPPVFALRPHHGLCLAFFEGKGYSEAFTRNMQHMLDGLADEETMVRLVVKSDGICSACPNQAGQACLREQRVSGYDQKVLALCDLRPDTVLPFRTFAASVQTNILSVGKLSQVCAGCQWEEICRAKRSRWLERFTSGAIE